MLPSFIWKKTDDWLTAVTKLTKLPGWTDSLTSAENSFSVNLGAALSETVTTMCTLAVVDSEDTPLSDALTVSSNWVLLLRSSSLATVIVPRTGSTANEFATFPARNRRQKKKQIILWLLEKYSSFLHLQFALKIWHNITYMLKNCHIFCPEDLV